jgi:hypothetical protein
MISRCPHCHEQLKFSKAQYAKIEKALAGLQPGKTLKLSCPSCKKSIELEAGNGGKGGGIMEDILYSSGEDTTEKSPPPKPMKAPPNAPQPPDISWLARGGLEEADDWVEDVPTALILVPAANGGEAVAGAFKGLGYQIVAAKSVADAVERLRFTKFSAVAFHAAFEKGGVAGSFHRHMKAMAMDKRRDIYYVLIGSTFKTFYDLEALAHSVNLVVNDRELKYLPLILKKGLSDYEELFSPLTMTLREHGRR